MGVKDLSGISITLDMDISNFNRAMDNVKKYTSQLYKDLANLDKALEFNPNSIDTLRAKMITLQDGIEKVTEQLILAQEQRDRFALGSSQWDRANLDVMKYSASYDELSSKLIDVINKMNGVDTKVDAVGNAFDDTGNKIDDTTQKSVALGTIWGNLTSDAIRYGLKSISSIFNDISNVTKKTQSAIISIYKNGIEYNMEVESYTTAISANLNGDVKAAEKVVDAMRNVSRSSTFSTSALLDSTQQLIASGISADEATIAITNLGKALSFAGKGDDELKRMAQNLNQIQNSGKATAQDLKQFAYAGVPIYTLLADYSSEFNEITKDSVIQYSDLVAALNLAGEEGGKFYEAFIISSSTMAGQISKLKSNWQELCGVIAYDTTSTINGVFLPKVNEALVATLNWEEEGFGSLGEAMSSGITDIINVIAINSPELIDAGWSLINDILNGLLTEDENGNTALEIGIETLVSNLINYVADPEFISRLFDIGASIAKGILKGIKSGLKNWFKKVDDNWKETYGTDTGVNWGFDWQSWSGGFGSNAPRLSNYSSRGYSSGGISLNASFTINNANSINEKVVRQWASVMADQINEELGFMM